MDLCNHNQAEIYGLFQGFLQGFHIVIDKGIQNIIVLVKEGSPKGNSLGLVLHRIRNLIASFYYKELFHIIRINNMDANSLKQIEQWRR